MRNFIFIKSATDMVTMPTNSLSHTEYTSATTVTLYFSCYKSGKKATVSVVLTVTSGKASSVVEAMMQQVSSGSSASLKYDAVNGTYFTPNVTGVTSITTNVEPTISGTDGDDGVGIPAGGAALESLRKTTAADNDTEWSGKAFHYISCNFYDDLGTTKHYLPLGAPPNEQTYNSNLYAAFLMPCDGKVISVELRIPDTVAAGANITMSVEKTAIGSDLSAETLVESESVAMLSTSDEEIAHFLFDNAAVSAGESLFVAIQNDVDISATQHWVVTVVLELNWSTRFTQATVVISS